MVPCDSCGDMSGESSCVGATDSEILLDFLKGNLSLLLTLARMSEIEKQCEGYAMNLTSIGADYIVHEVCAINEKPFEGGKYSFMFCTRLLNAL